MGRSLALVSCLVTLALIAGCRGPLGKLVITQVHPSPRVPVTTQGKAAPSPVSPLAGGGTTSSNAGGVNGTVTGLEAGSTVEVLDFRGRLLSDRPVPTSFLGRFAIASLQPSGPVIVVRATVMVGGEAQVLERAVRAPRLPGAALAELTPASTLVMKTMREMAEAKRLDMSALPIDALDAFTRAVDAMLDPAEAAKVPGLSDEAAADRLGLLMAEWPELRTLSEGLFAEAGAPEWGGYMPGYVPPAQVALHHTPSGGGTPGPTPTPAGTIRNTVNVGNAPWALATAPNGDVWVTVSGDNVVKAVGADGTVKGTYAVGLEPTAIAFDAGGRAWVCNRSSNSLTVLKSDGTTDFTVAVGNVPTGVAFDATGNAWIAIRDDDKVSKVSSTGVVLGTFPAAGGPNGPHGMGVDQNGDVWTEGYYDNMLWKLDASGNVLNQIPIGSFPDYIAFDAAGNLWLSVENDNVVKKLALNGTVLGTFPVGTHPYHIVFDPGGDAWVANYDSANVTRLANDGTVKGTYAAGANPLGIAIDGAGNLWVANRTAGTLTQLAR